MNLELIRTLTEKYPGGLSRLASDIGMSEANLHRCININKIQAGNLEAIAARLKVDIRLFFDQQTLKSASQNEPPQDAKDSELIDLCKQLVANYQQRDRTMSRLIEMVSKME